MDGIGESVVSDGGGDEFYACAVDGGVDNLEVFVTFDHIGAE